MYKYIICTTEALEIKRAASSVCLRRIVALCSLGVYVVRPGVYGVPSQQILYSVRLSRGKTGFPAHSVVQTGYTTPTLRFSDTLLIKPSAIWPIETAPQVRVQHLLPCYNYNV